MGWLEGLLGGYVDRHHQILDQEFKREQDARQMEANIYQNLLNSPDPKVYGLAATGLLSMATPSKRKSGLAGWMGEMERSPIYGQLMQYINTPQFRPAAGQVAGQIPESPGVEGSAAQTTNSPTEPGAQPPTAPQPAPGPATPPMAGAGALPFMQGGRAPWQAPFQPSAKGAAPVTTAGVAPTAAPAPARPNAPTRASSQPPPALPPAAAVGGMSFPSERAERGVTAALQGMTPPPTLQAFSPLYAGMEDVPAVSMGSTQSLFEQPAPGTPSMAELRAEQPTVPRFSSSATAEAPTPPPPPPPEPIFAPRAPLGVGAPPAPPAPQTADRPPLPSFLQEGTWEYPQSFPTLYQTTGQQSGGTLGGQYDAYVQMYRQNGLAEPEARQAALDAVMQQKQRGVGQSWAEGNIVADPQSPTGYSQDLYLRSDPTQRTRIPAQPPNTPEYLAKKATAVGEARAGAELTRPQKASNTMQLRDDWRVISQKVRDGQTAVAQMKTAYNTAKQTGNIAGAAEAMIVLFERALDPDSVVREAEAARPAQFSGLLTRIQGALERLVKGGASIPLPELESLVTLADDMTQAAAARLDDERLRIQGMATDLGLNPAHIIPPTVGPPPRIGPGGATMLPTAAPAAAKPGATTLDSEYEVLPDGTYRIKR